MKHTLLAAVLLFLSHLVQAQCTPQHDFGAEPLGVYPDTVVNFMPATVDSAYVQQIDVKIPSNGDFANLPGVVIDSARVESIENLPPGLSLTCAGNASSPCTYLGGTEGCAIISGTPTAAGNYPLAVTVTFYGTFLFNPTSIPYLFEGYEINVSGITGIESSQAGATALSLSLQPNPADERVTLRIQSPRAARATLRILDLVGKQVLQRSAVLPQGSSQYQLATTHLPQGIYLVQVASDDMAYTSRLIVTH